MTAGILEQPTTTPASHNQPDELHHYYCCNPDIAMCGADIAAHEDIGYINADEDDACPMCAHVYNDGLPCPVPGCHGNRTRRLLRAVSNWITGGAA